MSGTTGFSRNYQAYPYGDYDRTDNSQLLFPLAGGIDGRRPPKERVLGIPTGEGGRAYPFGELATLGTVAVVAGEGDVIFWDGLKQAAMAYRTTLNDGALSFRVLQGQIRDEETESVWRVDGLAVSGPLAPGARGGARLGNRSWGAGPGPVYLRRGPDLP